MKTTTLTGLALSGLAFALMAAPAFADGDAAKGEQIFNKCKACHSIVKDDGTAVVKGGIVGPNLYGVVGRAAGSGHKGNSNDAFKYGTGLEAMNKKGLVWTADLIAEYVTDPTAFVKKQTGDDSLRSNMTFKLPQGGADVAAYLASVAPATK